MKKIMYLVLLTTSMQSALAMDREGADNSGYSCLPQVLSDEQAPLNLGIVDFVSRAGNWLQTNIDALDQAVGAGAAARQAHEHAMEPHAQIVREALAQGTLEQAISRASKERSPQQFVSLLIGMNYLKIQPNEDTKSIIQQRLNVLKLKTREQTRTMLEERLKEERNLHELRKQFIPKQQMSDDEDYSTLDKFADTILNDEEQ